MRLWKVTVKPRLLAGLGLALCCFSLIIFTQVNTPAATLSSLPNSWPPSYRFRLHRHNKIESTVNTQPLSFSTPSQQSTVNSQQSTIIPVQPELISQVHPLPPTLANWQDSTDSGDYFDQVKPPNFGHLLWSKFPIQVYVEHPVDANKSEKWVAAVLDVVREWGVYLPLEVVDSSEVADIRILRRAPPLRQGVLRSRSGEATYELYARRDGDKTVLSHRFSVYLNPNQVGKYIPATARHELGHALGIWGHSLMETDVLYFSQVRNPPPISARDVNTLKRVYEQQTRLGWEFQRLGD